MTGTSARLTAALADRYRLERELGQGGMAVVYLAEDLRHSRRVAIKVLHPELSAVLGGERFLAEIKVTANLQHPHILGLIDSGEADGLLYYVMPYVAGESLRARLARERQLPVDEALRISREVASALDYAHRQGVVHRDIKPENTLLQDGAALVADFGIALAVHQAGGNRMTQTGMSLGTPAYMSPEQAMGEREIGPRSDVYALGAMTYEMLAGEPPFTGPNSQAIVAKVLTEPPPPLRAKRPMAPPAAEAAILTALQKLPADRWGSAHEFSEALTGAGTPRSQPAATVPMAAAKAPAVLRRRVGLAWAGWAAAAVAAGVAAWALFRPRPELPPSRLAILVPGLGGSGASSTQRHIAFLPNGQGVVYSVLAPDGTIQLWRQALDAENGSPIDGARTMATPLVSPDGRYVVGMQGVTRQVLRVPLAGGSAELVAAGMPGTDVSAFAPDGSLWYSDGADLGQVVGDSLVTRIRARQLRLQQILPDGHTALTVRTPLGNATGPVVLVNLTNGTETPLLATPVLEARVTQGMLVWVAGGGILQAAPLDKSGIRIASSPVTIATNVAITGQFLTQIAVSDNGNLAYIPQEPASLVFVDRRGASRLVTGERRNFHHPLFSPDGRRLSFDFNSVEGRNVWILALGDGTLSRATFDRDGHDATWTPDGRFLTYIVPVAKPGGGVTLVLLKKRPGSAEAPDTLLVSPALSYTGVWLRDGSALVTTATDVRRDPRRPDSALTVTGSDAAIIRNGGKGPLEPLVASRFAEAYAGGSPDGRWISFTSDQSGREEVYVRDLKGERDQVLVSTEGGSEPVWSPDGTELFYRETRQENPYLMAARIVTTPQLAVTARKRLFPIGDIVSTAPHANYDVSPDGRTFVMVRSSPAARVVVIQNLPGLVRRMRGEGSGGS